MDQYAHAEKQFHDSSWDLASDSDSSESAGSEDSNLGHQRREEDEAYQCLKNMQKRMSYTCFSTSFSGIDSPGTALNQLAVELGVKLNRRKRRSLQQLGAKVEKAIRKDGKHTFGIEWEPHSQRELKKHPAGPRCLFSDIADFAAPCVRSRLQQLADENKLQTVLLPWVKSSPQSTISLPTA